MASGRPSFGSLRLESSTFKGWAFVFVAGTALALVALIDRGGLDAVNADGSTGCQLEVTAEQLNIRSGPGPDSPLVQTLTRGERVDGTPTVTDGFRELEDGQWAADQFLTPVPGSNCG
ncbi:SH3 domain-containing protein [Pseudonocardia nigra]|uniref:SH3 domain-containing protein n=1 Tax=Pseudonocardia nigra TaxID=1921578 RepID=UPI001FE7A1EE|nr:SH3 domain-containing protein [Pseudonocardia nigra]